MEDLSPISSADKAVMRVEFADTLLDFIQGSEIDETEIGNQFAAEVAFGGAAFVEGWNRALKEVGNFVTRYTTKEIK